MEDAHVYSADACVRRQFVLMEVRYESKSSGGRKFPRIQYFSFYFEFQSGKKRKIFQEIIRKVFHSVFTHRGNNVSSLPLCFLFPK